MIFVIMASATIFHEAECNYLDQRQQTCQSVKKLCTSSSGADSWHPADKYPATTPPPTTLPGFDGIVGELLKSALASKTHDQVEEYPAHLLIAGKTSE